MANLQCAFLANHHILVKKLDTEALLPDCRVYVGITRQSILWDIHTNKCGSCQLLGHCLMRFVICYIASTLRCF